MICRFSLLLLISSPALSSSLSVSHLARSIQPGEAVALKVSSSQPIRLLSGRAGKQMIPFYRTSDHQWVGLLGLDLNTKPGAIEVVLEAQDEQSQKLTTVYVVEVVSKSFPTRRLTLDSKYVNPPEETLARIREESALLKRTFSLRDERKIWSGPFQVPVAGQATSSFGKRSILNGQPRSPHSGADFRASTGTPVKAPNRGRIVLARDLYFSGNTVIVDHGLGLFSTFAHLDEFLVSTGDEVSTGQVIGKAGATGRVTGPHLHWAVRLNGSRVDPLSLIQITTDIHQDSDL